MSELEKIENVIEELESVQTERIRAEERLKLELNALGSLGFASIESAQGGVVELKKKREKKEKKFNSDYADWCETYSGVIA